MMMVMIMWEVLKSLHLGNGQSYPSTPIHKGNTKTAPALPIAAAASYDDVTEAQAASIVPSLERVWDSTCTATTLWYHATDSAS